MDNRELILLGLLKTHSLHGYQINEFIESNLNSITNLKKPTAYAILERLHKEGFIDEKTEKKGNRPPRRVYSINDKGREYFYELLLANLSSPESIHFNGDVGLIFSDSLPLHEMVKALKEKLVKSEKLMEQLERAPIHGSGIGVALAIDHKKTLLEAEIHFLKKTIQRLDEKNK